MKDIIVLKGQVVYAESPERLTVRPDTYLVAEGGKVAGVYDALPDAYAGVRVEDWGTVLSSPASTTSTSTRPSSRTGASAWTGSCCPG